MDELKAALVEAQLTIAGYDQTKSRPVRLPSGPVSIKKFSEILKQALGRKIKKFPDVLYATGDMEAMADMVADYASKELQVEEEGFVIPQEVSHLTLNVDMSSTDQSVKKFFCTTPDELRDMSVSGQYYMGKCGLSPVEAVQAGIARAVVPKYMPRRNHGIHTEKNFVTQAEINYFNNYVPPMWELWKRRNEKEWDKLPAKPPAQIIKMIQHVIPNKEERNYFYAWMYTSMTRRAYVYLVLCGLPGVGKNRLKLLMRSLHGCHNSADGKKETFGENQSKFNSQMEENTFLWFDELKYGPDMEPRMKEYQNDFISIEKKGQDASRSTEIFCSMVISNNYPRDNYILFNSRKFAPLVLGDKPLTASMTTEEITDLSELMDDSHPRFDVKMMAQVAKWILTIGEKYTSKWPNLEYQGPKYWELAHTSMSRWQKISILVTTVENRNGPSPGWDSSKQAFLWSKVEESLRRKKEFESKDYRDPTTVKAFFETYRDRAGNPVFEITEVKGTVTDFWIKPIRGLLGFKTEMSLNSSSGAAKIIGVPANKVKIKQEDKIVSKATAVKEEKKPVEVPKLLRPVGISQLRWREMKRKHEEKYGVSKDDELDL